MLQLSRMLCKDAGCGCKQIMQIFSIEFTKHKRRLQQQKNGYSKRD